MRHNTILITLIALIILVYNKTDAKSAEVKNADKPNVLLIITDQQTIDAMSCAGNAYLNTPAMDKLAKDGIRFTNNYVTQPLCLPFRTSLQTALYPHEVGVRNNGNDIQGDVPLLGNLMADAGYKCDYFGKWHVGTSPENAGYKNYQKGQRDHGIAELGSSYLLQNHEKPFFLTVSFVNKIAAAPDPPVNVAKVFEKMGGKLVGTGTWSFTQQEFSVEVGKIKKLETQPDVIMGAAFGPFHAGLVTSLRSAGITAPYFAPDSVDEPSSIGLGAVAEGVVFTSAVFAEPGSDMAAFNKKYKEKYGKDNTVAPPALGYDAVKLVEAAVMKAGAADGKSIRDALDALKDIQGATGSLTYAGNGRNIERNVALCKVKDGQKTLIKWVKPAQADIPKPE